MLFPGLKSFTDACSWLDAKPSAAALLRDAARRRRLAGAGERRVLDSDSRRKEWGRGVNNDFARLSLPARRAINTFPGRGRAMAWTDGAEEGMERNAVGG